MKYLLIVCLFFAPLFGEEVREYFDDVLLVINFNHLGSVL